MSERFGPVRAGSLKPATVAMLLGAVLGIAALGVGTPVAALLVVAASRASFWPALIGAGVGMAVIGAIFGWAVWRTVVDRIDWPRLEADQRLSRIGAFGRTRVRARRLPDRRIH